MKFEDLGINNTMLQVIQREGFEKPTSIQEKSIPHILQGKDVIAGASTGSGKTLAFTTAIAKCKRGNGLQALVLTPTRELAVQVAEEVKKFSKLQVLEIYGGVSINPQISRLRRTDVVVGTPGRVLDHISRRTMNLKNIKVLVLDEADRMLDMGFIDDVETIIRECPKQRQTLLFSATISGQVSKLAGRYMNDQVKILAESFVDPSKLKQIYYDVPNSMKFSLLVHLLKKETSGLAMVFCNTRRNVDFVVKNLKAQQIKAIAIHGGLSQAKRTKTINSFHDQRVPVLVCTDVAARGLHIEGVTHIYNYDIPKEPKQYIHRIGRTARAGEKGEAINILADRDHENFARLLRDVSVKITKMECPIVEKVRLQLPRQGQQRYGQRYGQRNGQFGHRNQSRGQGGYGGWRNQGGFGQRNQEYNQRSDQAKFGDKPKRYQRSTVSSHKRYK